MGGGEGGSDAGRGAHSAQEAAVSVATSSATRFETAASALKMPSQCFSARSFEMYSMNISVQGPQNSVLKLSDGLT